MALIGLHIDLMNALSYLFLQIEGGLKRESWIKGDIMASMIALPPVLAVCASVEGLITNHLHMGTLIENNTLVNQVRVLHFSRIRCNSTGNKL